MFKMADAIMDRIVHNADTVDLGKVNMRELLARKSNQKIHAASSILLKPYGCKAAA